jgi:hypothetical protein
MTFIAVLLTEYGILAVGGNLLCVWRCTLARALLMFITRGLGPSPNAGFDFEADVDFFRSGNKALVSCKNEVQFTSSTLLHSSLNPSSPGFASVAMPALLISTSR